MRAALENEDKRRDEMKLLKIQFWKAEKALAMQILEQEGLPSCKEDGLIKIVESPWIHEEKLWLRGSDSRDDWEVEVAKYFTNIERDSSLYCIVNSITDELFSGEGELKIGEMCEVKYDGDDNWKKRKLIAILSEQYDRRFITEMEDCPTEYSSWNCARPIAKRTEPTMKVCGQLITYTWEEK